MSHRGSELEEGSSQIKQGNEQDHESGGSGEGRTATLPGGGHDICVATCVLIRGEFWDDGQKFLGREK